MSEHKWKIAAIVAACAAVGSLASTVLAETPAPSLPSSCSSGEIVVSEGSGRFACEPVLEALGLRSCNTGDFVTVTSSGRLQCVRPSSTPWGIQGLLPDCSSGSTLVSEGFGKWRCVEAPR